MKCYPYLKVSKRDFVRDRNRHLKSLKKELDALFSGSGIIKIWGDLDYYKELTKIENAVRKIKTIFKPLI